uniref:Uncharacterized protein n=1 Tax=Strongyloides stercoralis TaxID=6248 RepID=A0AAF5DPD2_STRER
GCFPKIEFTQFLPIVYLTCKAIRKPKFQLEFSKKFGPTQVNPLELEDLFNVASCMFLFSYVLKAVSTLILIPVPRSHKEPSLKDERGNEEQGEGERDQKGKGRGKEEERKGKKRRGKGEYEKRKEKKEHEGKEGKKNTKRKNERKKTHNWRKKEFKKASGF